MYCRNGQLFDHLVGTCDFEWGATRFALPDVLTTGASRQRSKSTSPTGFERFRRRRRETLKLLSSKTALNRRSPKPWRKTASPTLEFGKFALSDTPPAQRGARFGDFARRPAGGESVRQISVHRRLAPSDTSSVPLLNQAYLQFSCPTASAMIRALRWGRRWGTTWDAKLTK